MSLEQAPSACPACAAAIAGYTTVRCTVRGGRFGTELAFLQCPSCGFTCAPANTHAYGSECDFAATSRPRAANRRVGTRDRPGREYCMAVMAVDILRLAGTTPTSILVYGPGLSLDHAHLARRYPEIRVGVCDLKNMQDNPNFVPPDSTEKFDVVVACEVAEHFTDIQADFATLLSKVSDRGIAVLSTNVSDGGDLAAQAYPFIPGHTAYYSGRALRSIVQRHDPSLRVDFRTPRAALAQLGPRKRYVLIHRDAAWQGIAEYFSMHLMAPSEGTYFRLGLMRHWAWIKRMLKT